MCQVIFSLKKSLLGNWAFCSLPFISNFLSKNSLSEKRDDGSSVYQSSVISWLILVSLVFCGCLMMCFVVTLESQSYTSDCHINIKESEKKKSQNRNSCSLRYKVALIRINVSKKIWVSFFFLFLEGGGAKEIDFFFSRVRRKA